MFNAHACRSHTKTDVSAMPQMSFEPSGENTRAGVRVAGVLMERISCPVATSVEVDLAGFPAACGGERFAVR